MRLAIILGAIFFGVVAESQTQGKEQDRADGLNGQGRTETAPPRSVDGTPVPPFGHVLVLSTGGNFPLHEGYWESNLAAWPGTPSELDDQPPLSQAAYAGGPYDNAVGKRWVERINRWYREGECAGLVQDAFRSFDDGHSGIRPRAYPQLRFEKAIASLTEPGRDIFQPRITFGVQSYGAGGKSVIEALTRNALRKYYEIGGKPPPFQQAFRIYYENNFVFVAPASGSFTEQGDQFSCLSPFYLHAIGNSGSDSKLLKPLVFASAALPPDLKTRILRQGLLVPTLLNLFKSNINGDLLSPESHLPAYTLPPEADDDYDGSAPFLDGLLNAAHNLQHIPPVCRIRVEDFAIESGEDPRYDDDTYFEDNTYVLSGALRPGQTLVVSLDLRFSWTDDNRPIDQYVSSVLRGNASIEPLNQEASRITVRIPWSTTNNNTDLRTDLLLLVHDGTYFSSPAYISIRHIHKLDPITLGIPARERHTNQPE